MQKKVILYAWELWDLYLHSVSEYNFWNFHSIHSFYIDYCDLIMPLRSLFKKIRRGHLLGCIIIVSYTRFRPFYHPKKYEGWKQFKRMSLITVFYGLWLTNTVCCYMCRWHLCCPCCDISPYMKAFRYLTCWKS